jgi:Ca-activated chloride channel family protein
MVRPALVLLIVMAAAGQAGAIEVGRPAGMYTQTGAALAVVDSKIEVTVRGPILETVITQRFRNTTDHPTEATYIFPLPHDAAVTAMAIKSGTRTIHASIEPRETAQRRYETAVGSGVAAALLDQERPDIFTQTVAAIPAKGTVEVTLRYDSVARFQDGTWEMVLPLVVAPRYVPGAPTGRGTTGSGRQPDTDRSPDASRVTPPAAPGGGGSTDVAIHFEAKPEGVTSPSHELAIRGSDVTFRDPKSDHDAVVRWRGSSSAGWVEQNADGGYAAVIVTGPAAPARRSGSVKYLLILDRSAASRGDADTVARPLVRSLLTGLAGSDRVSVTGSDNIAWSAPADVQRALEQTWSSAPAAFDLTRILGAARPDGAPIVLVTGGLVADDAAAVAAAKKLGVAVHVIGVGPAPARGALTQIAAASGGTARFALPGDDLAAIARAVVADTSTPPPALSVTWGTLAAVDVVPAGLPRLGAGQAMLVLARVSSSGTSSKVSRANGRANGELFAIEVLPTAKSVDGSTSVMGPLARRWARNRLDEMLASRHDRGAVARHAQRYGLVSPYTSMVAIGDEVVVQGGVRRSVPVQVSVPAGMKWQAIKKETNVEVEAHVSEEKKPDVAVGSTTTGTTLRQGDVAGAGGRVTLNDKDGNVDRRGPADHTRDHTKTKPTKDSSVKDPKRPPPVVARPPSKEPPRSDASKHTTKKAEQKPTSVNKPNEPASVPPPMGGVTRPESTSTTTVDATRTSPDSDDPIKGRRYRDQTDKGEKSRKNKSDDEEEARSSKKKKLSKQDRAGADGDEDDSSERAEVRVSAAAPATARESLDFATVTGGMSYSARRTWRLAASLGGGLLATGGEQTSVVALGGRFEVAAGRRTAVGLDASAWLVGGTDLQGRALFSFSRLGIARFFEFGGGFGLHFGDGFGPAFSLGLRFHLPPVPRAAAFLRYDGALLLDENDAQRGLNTFTFGAEWGF